LLKLQNFRAGLDASITAAQCVRLYAMTTNNLRKAHVTRDSRGPATLAISVQHAIK